MTWMKFSASHWVRDKGGGLTAERRAFRERLRLRAAELFIQEEGSQVIARQLRVGVRAVQRWRQAWTSGGSRALRSKGPASLPLHQIGMPAQQCAGVASSPIQRGFGSSRASAEIRARSAHDGRDRVT
jgi:transposase-like protein